MFCFVAIAALSNPGIEVHPADACPAAGVRPPAFCSLPEAIAWAAAQVSDGGQGSGDEEQQQRRLCLHSGVHQLREPLLLTSAHSHMHWSVCEGGGGGGAAGATISGGFSVPAASWQPQLAGQQEQGGTSGLWTAPLPPALSHRRDRGSIPAQAALRTLFVGGARANRTSANASALLGDLRVTADGYEAERPVPWDGAAAGAAVELVYFQQVAPWQAQRCMVAHAAGRSLVVAQPCFARLQSMVRAVPGLPRNTSYGRSGCADPACRQPDGGLLLGNPMGSGLPLFVENFPLGTAAPLLLPGGGGGGEEGLSEEEGLFWVSQEDLSPGAASPGRTLWYRPRPQDLSADGRRFASDAVLPVAEGLIAATGLRGATFQGIAFEHAAWSGASAGAGFVDLQDGVHFAAEQPANGSSQVTVEVPGAFDCRDCSGVTVRNCSFARVGGSAISFGGVSQRNAVEATAVSDTSCSGVQIGIGDYTGNDTAAQCTGNRVVGNSIARAGQEYSGCVGVFAGCNVGLDVSHNTIAEMPYGAVSVGCGASHALYARDNVVSHNAISRWMLRMQDSGAIYMDGVQPNSSVHHNYMSRQGLTGLEPPPPCDAPLRGARCTLAQVRATEDLWIKQIHGWKYNLSSCAAPRAGSAGWCNQSGNAHGGAVYPDNGSSGWDLFANVFEDVYHWAFVWDARKMKDMRFRDSWTDSPLFTNAAAAHNVSIRGNTLVNRSAGEPWPAAALAVVQGAGSHLDIPTSAVAPPPPTHLADTQRMHD